jgi:hypothetical protein
MHTLSKSDYTLARTCDTKLYFRENRFPDTRASSPYLQLLADGGFMVDALARAQRADGVLLEPTWDAVADFAKTCELLERDTVTIFQATLLSGKRFARVDIIEKRGDDVSLIEVKAKSFDRVAHADDLAAGGKGEFRAKRKPHAHLAAWLPKFEDLTFQVLMFEKLFPAVRVRPYIVLIDKTKRTTLDGAPRFFEIVRQTRADGSTPAYTAHFTGDASDITKLDVLTTVDASDDVSSLRAEVDAEAARFEALIDKPFDSYITTLGTKCSECEFRVDASVDRNGFAQCWGPMATVTPHILDLQSIGKVQDANGAPIIESLTRDGKASLFDIPMDRLKKKDGTVGPQAERQIRQITHAKSGVEWIDASLKDSLAGLRYPMHFIDFEASRLAIPYHAKMRPYGQVAFQWSVHTVDAPGAPPRHTEWLNAADEWPNMTFARSLRDVIGESDTVLAWSPFERSQLNEIAREHPQFVPRNESLELWVDALTKARIFDLHKCAVDQYYHPGMGGRTSIKVVLDALWKSDATMRGQLKAWTGRDVPASEDPYHALPPLEIDGVRQDVREGTGAMRAYEAMMYGVERADPHAKAKWRKLLLQYCELDTLSMVLIFEYWRRATGLA